MIRYLFLGCLVPLLTASCAEFSSHSGAEYPEYFPQPAETTTEERVQSREILHWTNNPTQKERVGYLHRYETRAAGSRESRTSYTICDAGGSRTLGFITAEGVFYRFDEHGRLGEKVGEFKIIPLGLKIFLGIPTGDNLDLETIDPYQ